MKHTRTLGFWLAGLMVTLVVLLRFLAHACPADPTLIAGFYDADSDEIVHFILTCSGVAPIMPTLATPTRRVVHAVVESHPARIEATHGYPSLSRSPPVALASFA